MTTIPQIFIKDLATKPEQASQSIAIGSGSEKCAFVPPSICEGEVSLAKTLSDCITLMQKFVSMDKPQAIVASLWAASTWFVVSCDLVPYLLITSSVKRCGKTRLLEFLQQVVRFSKRSDDCTVASIFRITSMPGNPTLLMDEIDQFMVTRREFNAILNSGNRRGATVTRSAAKNNGGFSDDVREYDCFGFKAFAGIKADHISDTLSDRSIIIKLRRKTEQMKRLRIKNFSVEFDSIRQRFYSLSLKYGKNVQEVIDAGTIAFPDSFNDRQIDMYEPLWAILEVMCEGRVLEQCKKACELCLSSPDPTSDLALLEKVRSYSTKSTKDWVPTAELVSFLSSFPTWKNMSPKRLSCIMARFKVKPVRKPQLENKRGYLTAQINQAYLQHR